MPRRRLQHEYDARRDRLLEKAWELLLRDGLERLTLNRLLKEAGVSKGAYYHYFGSWEELLNDVVERIVMRALDTQQARAADSSKSATTRLGELLGISSGRPEATLPLRGLFLQLHHAEDLELLARLMTSARRLGLPWLEQLVRNGIADDGWSTPFPTEMAELVLAAWDQTLLAVFDLAKNDDTGPGLETAILERLEATTQATELLLGIPPGALARFERAEVKRLLETSRRLRSPEVPPRPALDLLPKEGSP